MEVDDRRAKGVYFRNGLRRRHRGTLGLSLVSIQEDDHPDLSIVRKYPLWIRVFLGQGISQNYIDLSPLHVKDLHHDYYTRSIHPSRSYGN